MRMVVHSFRTPRWVAPLLVVVALVLLPFALALGLVVAGLALGVTVLRILLSGPGKASPDPVLKNERDSRYFSDGSVIDADYEIKDEKEKEKKEN